MKITDLKVVRSRVTVLYEPVVEIRKRIFDLEAVFGDGFLPPQLIPLPDSLPAELPRIEFRSQHGHTTAQFAQTRADLITEFDANFNTDLDKCIEYIRDRSQRLTEAMAVLAPDVAVTGLALMVRWSQAENDENVGLEEFQRRILRSCMQAENAEEIRVVRSVRLDGKYLLNMNISNYRIFFSGTPLDTAYPRLGQLDLKDWGVEMEVEINDRAAYNDGQATRGTAELDTYIDIVKSTVTSPPCLEGSGNNG